MITTLWCGRGDLNAQAFRRRILSPLCMPFHHVHLEIFVSLEAGSIIHTCRYFVKCFFAKMYPFLKYISSKIFFGALDSALRPLNRRRLRHPTPLNRRSHLHPTEANPIKCPGSTPLIHLTQPFSAPLTTIDSAMQHP